MPETELKRAYREGQVDARLTGHDEHLARINGSIERGNTTLSAVERKVDKLSDQVVGLTLVMPKLQTVAEEVTKAELVAQTLKQKQLEQRTSWDRAKGTIAWAGGLLLVVVTSADLISRLF